MKESTKTKIKVKLGKAKRIVKDLICPVLFGATAGAAWYGYAKSIKNGIAVDKLRKQEKEIIRVVDYNADVVANNAEVLRRTIDRASDLERRQLELFEQALKQTEGKAE